MSATRPSAVITSWLSENTSQRQSPTNSVSSASACTGSGSYSRRTSSSVGAGNASVSTCALAGAPTTHDSQRSDVLMELQPLLKYALDRWMKAGHERRLFPAIWSDLSAYVRAGEPLRKQP